MTSGQNGSRNTGLKPETVETVFRVFIRRFGHKFKQQAEDPAAREVWLRDLRREGVTDTMAARGLAACASLEWPPSVGEFVKFCRITPEQAGLPPAAKARQEICHAAGSPGAWEDFKWSHVVVYYTAKSLKVHANVILGPEGRKLIDYHYAEACKRYIAGESMAAPVQAGLPQDVAGGPVTDEMIEATYAAIGRKRPVRA